MHKLFGGIMKKIFAVIALFFAFASTSAVAKNDYSCDKKFIFFPGGPEGGPFGTIVYNQENYINQWSGQDNNDNKLPTGTYYYVIDLASVDDVYGSQTSGWIYLNRSSK